MHTFSHLCDYTLWLRCKKCFIFRGESYCSTTDLWTQLQILTGQICANQTSHKQFQLQEFMAVEVPQNYDDKLAAFHCRQSIQYRDIYSMALTALHPHSNHIFKKIMASQGILKTEIFEEAKSTNTEKVDPTSHNRSCRLKCH